MAVTAGLIEFLVEQLGSLGRVEPRRMFSGAGLFRDGLMFAIVIDDVLYFKTDDETVAAFDAEGLPPFSYGTRTGEKRLTHYRRAPERVLDDTDEMADWAARAFAVAQRADARKGRKKPPR